MSLFFFLCEKLLHNSGSFFGFLSNFYFVFLPILIPGPARLNFKLSDIKTQRCILIISPSSKRTKAKRMVIVLMIWCYWILIKKIVIHISALYFNYAINIKLYQNTLFSHSECITVNLYLLFLSTLLSLWCSYSWVLQILASCCIKVHPPRYEFHHILISLQVINFYFSLLWFIILNCNYFEL